MFAYTLQGKNIVLTRLNDGKQFTVNKTSHINFDDIKAAVVAQDWQKVADLVDPTATLATYADGKLEIKNGRVVYQGKTVAEFLSKRFIELYRQGFPVDYLVNFIQNVYENPSYRAVTGLFEFLDTNNMPITPDGCFFGYRRVTKDFKDIYTKTIDNSVGQEVTMDRNDVDDNPNNECSQGLHICSLDYLRRSGYGQHDDPIMLCKINPRDVVAFPPGYHHTKARVCRYEVVSVYSNSTDKEEIKGPAVSSVPLDK